MDYLENGILRVLIMLGILVVPLFIMAYNAETHVIGHVTRVDVEQLKNENSFFEKEIRDNICNPGVYTFGETDSWGRESNYIMFTAGETYNYELSVDVVDYIFKPKIVKNPEKGFAYNAVIFKLDSNIFGNAKDFSDDEIMAMDKKLKDMLADLPKITRMKVGLISEVFEYDGRAAFTPFFANEELIIIGDEDVSEGLYVVSYDESVHGNEVYNLEKISEIKLGLFVSEKSDDGNSIVAISYDADAEPLTLYAADFQLEIGDFGEFIIKYNEDLKVLEISEIVNIKNRIIE